MEAARVPCPLAAFGVLAHTTRASLGVVNGSGWPDRLKPMCLSKSTRTPRRVWCYNIIEHTTVQPTEGSPARSSLQKRLVGNMSAGYLMLGNVARALLSAWPTADSSMPPTQQGIPAP